MTAWSWFLVVFFLVSYGIAAYRMARSNWENDEDWRC